MTAPSAYTANELPDLRLWLRSQWEPGRPFHRVASTTTMGLQEPGRPYDPESYCRYEWRTLGEAGLWWVAEDMVDLLLAAAPSTPDDATGAELQVPAPAGLVVFAKPWFGLDARGSGNAVQVDALTWGTARIPGVEPEEQRITHRWVVNGHWRWQPYGPGRSLRRLQYIRPFVKGPEGAELKIKQEVRAWVR